jgi:hypothetical protein
MIVALLIALASQQPAPKVHSVIVANNRPSEPGLSPLRYADDDGARYYELLSMIGKADILSVLDEDSQRRFPKIAESAGPPAKEELDRRLKATFARIAADRERGERTVLYFVFVGHGSVGPDGQGAMHFLDGLFSRSDLFQKVIAESPADVNHVIIDACNAYLMVAGRGDTNAIDDAVDSFLEKERLDRYPNTGVLVSTSKAAEVHEWARFEAGVFSHEVRSAMVGAADVDADGDITYDEIRAFIAAANGRVRDPRARLDVFASPPQIHREEPIFDRRLAREAKTLRIGSELAGRHWLEDARGVRYADFHTSEAVTLTLVPSDVYYLRADTEEIEIPFVAAAVADASEHPRRPASSAVRGSEDLTFRRDLFAIPFGPEWYEGFKAAAPSAEVALTPDRSLSTKRIVAIAAGSAGVAALATGIAMGVAANAKANEYNRSIGPASETDPLREAAHDRSIAANALYIGGGALVTTALVLWLWPE